MRYILFFSILQLFASLSGAELPFVINKNDIKSVSIVLPENSGTSNLFAAEELQYFLQKIFGDKPEIHKGTQLSHTKKIFIGIPPENDPEIQNDESRIVVANGNLYLYGKNNSDTLQAVYRLLQDKFGCLFLSPFGDMAIPEKSDISIAGSESFHIKLPYRSLMNYFYNNHNQTDLFLVRNSQNLMLKSPRLQSFNRIEPAGLENHSIHKFMAPAKYFKDHPEFYSQNKNGERVRNNQLCFANREMRKLFSQNVLTHIQQKNSDSASSDREYWIEISAMDYPGKFCHCQDCAILEQKYQTPCGAFFEFLVELSDETNKNFPNIKIATLLYRKDQTEKPPKNLSFPKNFIGIFAPIDDNFFAPLDHDTNKETWEHLQKWSQIASNIWMWYYPNPYCEELGPYSALRRSIQDFKLIQAAGISGSYYEHDATANPSSNFADLESWVLLQLFSGATDGEKLIKKFMTAYYEDAAELMYEYFNDLENLRQKAVDEGTVGHFETPPRILGYFTVANMEKWSALFDKMEKTVQNNKLVLSRIRLVRRELDQLILRNFDSLPNNSPLKQQSSKTFSDRVAATFEQIATQRPTRYPAAAKAIEFETSTNTNIPEELQNQPPENIRQIYYLSGTSDPDAAKGYAKTHTALVAFPYGLFASDYRYVKSANGIKPQWKALKNRKLESTEITPDRYQLYRLGALPITPATRISTTSNGYFFRDIGMFADPSQPDTIWEIYLSLKFEGPAVPGSQKNINKVSCDRIVLVKQEMPELTPLPQEVENISEEKRKTIYPYSGHKQMVEDRNAANGNAAWENWTDSNSFHFGIYDSESKKNRRVFTIKKENFTNEKFTFFKIPTPTELTPKLLLYGGKWIISLPIGTAFNPKNPSQKYDIYLSLKYDASTQKILCDRALLITKE